LWGECLRSTRDAHRSIIILRGNVQAEYDRVMIGIELPKLIVVVGLAVFLQSGRLIFPVRQRSSDVREASSS
jgi:hypothetical protein